MKKFSIFFLLLFFIAVPCSAQIIGGPSVFSFNYRENWSSSATYEANDAVRGSDGKLYVATGSIAAGGANPWSTSPPPGLWAEATSAAAPAGPRGSQGLQGTQGETGNSITLVFFDSSTRPSPS